MTDQLRITGLASGTTVEVLSITGQRVAQLTTASLGVVDVTTLAAGTGMLRTSLDEVLRQT